MKATLVEAESGKGKSVHTKWVEKDTFDQGDEQRESFNHIKKTIPENVISGVNDNLQVHLATDTSKLFLGGVLFRLPGESLGTEAQDCHKTTFQVNMFISFKLEETETR